MHDTISQKRAAAQLQPTSMEIPLVLAHGKVQERAIKTKIYSLSTYLAMEVCSFWILTDHDIYNFPSMRRKKELAF
jgi:hypothetical protein